jgi:hypothetical protein
MSAMIADQRNAFKLSSGMGQMLTAGLFGRNDKTSCFHRSRER